MANNEAKVDFIKANCNDFQKMNTYFDRLNSLGSDLGFGKSFTAATPSLAQSVPSLAAPIQKFSTLESRIKSISALGTLQDRLDDIQNDLSKRHDLTKPLGAANFCCESLNKVSLATKNLKDYEDRFNLMRSGHDNLYSRF